jgi:hypothetical protein
VKPGQFVVGSFFASDNTCEICGSDGYKAMDERRAIPPMTDYLSETAVLCSDAASFVIGHAMVVDVAV